MYGEKEIPIEKIKVGESEQRLTYDEEKLQDLMRSIARIGLIYPLIVVPADGGFRIVSGHRRYAALERLGKKTAPCVVCDIDESRRAEITFAENYCRADLSPVETACAIKDCIDKKIMSVTEIADGFHRSEHWVVSMIAICDWPADVQEAIHHKAISVSAGSNLACVTDDNYRTFLVTNAVEQGATARTTSAWLQAWRSMQPQEEAILSEPVSGGPPPQPIVPQAPCFCCSQIFAVNEMSHVPICGACVQIMRNISMPNT